ncbi:MAG: hypothetical protein AAF519_07190 [Bacteroidota bacterium]
MVTIHTPTSDLDKSIDFYKTLNYRLVRPSNPCLFNDSNTLIEVNPDRYARAGIKMYKSSWVKEVQGLKEVTELFNIDRGYLLNDANGCWIYLIEEDFEFPADQPDINAALTGNFVGLSLESANIQKSFSIWQHLGFEIIQGDISTSYMTLSNADEFKVSLMKPLTCPHLFFNPSMTFFNGDRNMEVIAEIRASKIPITEEITYFNEEGLVDNIIIKDPGGYGFFIFND